jgi:phage baseplate assembly protein W
VATFNADKYQIVSKTNDIFSDFSSNLDIHPNTRDVIRIRNEQAITAAIKNLLLTDMYERPFQPSIGSNVRYALFENPSAMTAIMIQTAIEDTIRNHEKRIQLVSVVVEPDIELQTYNIKLTYTLINSVTPVTMTMFLDRIR